MNKYCIYLHKNKINNKIYIGQTCQKPQYRWNNGNGYKQCSYFYSAIQKYGWDNFEHIILENNLTAQQANQKEEEYIKYYKSNEKQFGYNLSAGGNNHKEISESTRKKFSNHAKNRWEDESIRNKMSQIMKEKWQDPKYIQLQRKSRENALKKIHQEGKTSFISDEGKKRISDARKKYIAQHGTPTQGKGHSEATRKILSEQKIGKKNPMYGKKHTEEWKQMMSQKMTGRSGTTNRKIKCVETDQIFQSITKAAKWCNLKSSSHISEVAKGKGKTAGKHPITKEPLHWKYVD